MSRKKIRIDYINERVLREAKYMLITVGTLQKIAKFSNRSLSSVYRDLTIYLPKINAELAREVRIVMNKNIKERSAKGGEVIKQKKLLMEKNKQNL